MTHTRSATVDARQLRELELVLADAWPTRTVSDSGVGARMSVADVLAPADRIEWRDTEGTPIAMGTRVGEPGTAFSVDPLQAFAPQPFARLRVGRDSPTFASVLVFTGACPSESDPIWNQARAEGTAVVVLDAGNLRDTAHRVRSARAQQVTVLVLPAPNRAIRTETEWLHELEVVATRLVSPNAVVVPTPNEARLGCTILLTGLSGSGKSTIANALAERLIEHQAQHVVLLDGDDIRRALSSELSFSRSDRETNVRRLSWAAALVTELDGIAICAPIAPYESMRSEFRARVEAAGRCIIVHVSTPLEVCEARDRKGLYAQARAGAIPNFTGISDVYEEPEHVELRIDASVVAVQDAVDQIVARINLAE